MIPFFSYYYCENSEGKEVNTNNIVRDTVDKNIKKGLLKVGNFFPFFVS